MTVSQYVLNRILSCGATEVVVERIHKYLTAMGDDIWCGKIELGESIIHKRLENTPPPPLPPKTTRCQKIAAYTTCALDDDKQRRGTSR